MAETRAGVGRIKLKLRAWSDVYDNYSDVRLIRKLEAEISIHIVSAKDRLSGESARLQRDWILRTFTTPA